MPLWLNLKPCVFGWCTCFHLSTSRLLNWVFHWVGKIQNCSRHCLEAQKYKGGSSAPKCVQNRRQKTQKQRGITAPQVKEWGPLKGPFIEYGRTQGLSRRSRRACGPGAWARRPRPWQWQSCVWRAPCRWPRRGSRSTGTPSAPRGSPHRWAQRCASHHRDEPGGEWQAWWCPGYYHEGLCGGAWRLPCLDPFRLCRDQTCRKTRDSKKPSLPASRCTFIRLLADRSEN